MARLPIITYRRDIDVRVVLGQNVFELYQQIQRIVQKEHPGLANFFAEPIINAVKGEISWNTKATGPIVLASSLATEQSEQVASKLKRIHEDIRNLISKLKNSAKGNSASSESLQNMLMTPDLRSSLFMVGEELVLTQWGCYQFGSDAKNAELSEQIYRYPTTNSEDTFVPDVINPVDELGNANPPHSSDPTIPEATQNSGDAKKVDIAEPDPTPPITQIPDPDAPRVIIKKPWLWRWLVIALLLLLLLLGVWLKYCHQPVDNETEAKLRIEIAELWKKIDEKVRSCGSVLESNTQSTPGVVNAEEFVQRQAENQITLNGSVNVSLAWNDKSDLDLHVLQPDGNRIYFKPCDSANCGRLDVDANSCTRISTCIFSDRPLENISWPGSMLKGKYKVYVGMYSTNRSLPDVVSVPFTVQITKDGKQRSYQNVFQSSEIKCDKLCGTKLREIAEFTIE
jgi:hypothetical protein